MTATCQSVAALRTSGSGSPVMQRIQPDVPVEPIGEQVIVLRETADTVVILFAVILAVRAVDTEMQFVDIPYLVRPAVNCEQHRIAIAGSRT